MNEHNFNELEKHSLCYFCSYLSVNILGKRFCTASKGKEYKGYNRELKKLKFQCSHYKPKEKKRLKQVFLSG